MPINNIFWAGGKGYDIHLIWGNSGPDLTDVPFLVFGVPSPGSNVFAKNYVQPAPTDVILTFTPVFKKNTVGSVYNCAGVAGLGVNRDTGVVTTSGPFPAGTKKYNFIIVAQATFIPAAGPAQVFKEYIRVHIHQSITHAWLTPSPLTVRDGVTGYKFSILAQFDDNTMGEIPGDTTGINWTSANTAAVTVFANTGHLNVVGGTAAGTNVVITATLPASLGGGNATGTVTTGSLWSASPHTADIVTTGGGGLINPDTVMNVLFIPEGFQDTAADKQKFENIVNSIVLGFRTNHIFRPFDVLATSINYWRAFLPSREQGCSALYENYFFTRGADTIGVPMPDSTEHTAGDWTIENLFYAAGYPVPDHKTKTPAQIKTEWAAVLDPNPGPSVSDDLINNWKKYGDRRLLNERDTAIGLKFGNRPKALHNGDDARGLVMNPIRMNRNNLDGFLITLASGATILGQYFGSPANVNGKDYNYVIAVNAGMQYGGIRLGNASDPTITDLITSSVAQGSELKLTSAGGGTLAMNIVPSPFPDDAPIGSIGTTVHEFGHALGLGDEYGEVLGNFPASQVERLTFFGNLQARSQVLTGGNIIGAKIKWKWPRVKKAAVVDGTITPEAGNKYRIPLRNGQGNQFTVGDTVHLRLRVPPQTIDLDQLTSNAFEIESKSASEVVVKPKGGIAVTPAIVTFVKGSVLYIPVPAPASVFNATDYPYAEMIAFNIKNYIVTQNKPLTDDPCTMPANATQAGATQVPILNRGPGVSLPFCYGNAVRIVGLYSGGSRYDCDIYHPAGTCMMRGSENTNILEFCAVCRYVIVEKIDPYKHFEIDLDYNEIYPQK